LNEPRDERDLVAEFRQSGFLSDAIRDLVPTFRSGSKDWFDLAEDASRAMQHIAIRAAENPQVRGKTLDRAVLATFVQIRSAHLAQGTILMLERGMVVEGRTLVRSLLENSFCMGALHDAPDEFVKLFKADDQASRKAQADFVLAQKFRAIGPEQEQKLLHLIAKVEKGSRTLDMKKLAGLSPLIASYLLYRVLSNDSAHPSATSLRRYLNMADDGTGWIGFVIEPGSDDEIADSLYRLVGALIGVAIGMTQIVGDSEMNGVIAALAERNDKLAKLLP
jgi:hypothetical protein